VHNLKETMAKKGVEFSKECLITKCDPVAREVEQVIVAMMDEAASAAS
jgi:hypothetical protein